jgi:hypothetical protein
VFTDTVSLGRKVGYSLKCPTAQKLCRNASPFN